MRRNKITLTLNKPVYIGMRILELSKVLMYKIHYDYIKKKYDKSRLSFTDTDSLIYKIKTEVVNKGFSKDKEMFDVSNYSTKSKCYDHSSKIVVVKMKNKTSGGMTVRYNGLNTKMYLFLVNNSEHEKVKSVNKSVAATITHDEQTDVLLNKKYLRHSMNKIQSCKDHRTETFQINKI